MTWPNHLSRFCLTTRFSAFLCISPLGWLLGCAFRTPRVCAPDLRVHVSDAYVAMGTIMALHRRIFRALLIDLFFRIASLSRPHAFDASLIRLMTSVALFRTTLPRNTNSSTCSSSPSMTSLVAPGDKFTFGTVYFHTPFSACIFEHVRLTDGVS